jgi:hypothetical protein
MQTDYQQYLRSPAWRATRVRRLAASGYRCEFVSETDNPRHCGARCGATTGLEVHHRHYRSLGVERDDDLKVLCGFHHLVTHVLGVECERCGEATVDETFAVELVREAIEDAGDIGKVELANIDVPGLCDYCDHVMNEDD